jgi:hypothetical protein
LSPGGPAQVKPYQTAEEDSVLNEDWPVKAKLMTDEFYILLAGHLPSQHLGRITREHPEHEEEEKRNSKKNWKG